jgi:hypothetical protein
MRNEETTETGGPVFQPDTVLPSQFFAALRGKSYVEGEKRLMAAVLADAVECYMKHAFAVESKAHQMFLDAEAWIFDGEPRRWLFSFTTICDVLGLEPEYIKRGIGDWRTRRTATIKPSEAFRRGPSHRVKPADSEPLKKAV